MSAARRRARENPSRAEVRRQAEALGLRWEIGADDERDDQAHPDWDAIAVALDSWEQGHRAQAEAILPEGVRIVGRGAKATITDLPEEPPLYTWLGGDIDSVFGVKAAWGGDPRVDLDDTDGFHWSDLDPVRASDKDDIRRHPENYVYLPRLLAFGDYDNSGAVERSNYRVFLETFGERPGVYEIYGSHGSQAVGIRLTVEDDEEELVRTLSALADYPLLDEEDMSRLETEMQEEAYDNWARADFVREVEKTLDIEITNEGDMAELFWRALGASGRDAYVEGGGGVVFPIEEMAAKVHLQDLDKIKAEYELGDSYEDE